METLGSKLRRQRRRLGLTLDELAARTAISKPYLSLIETGRVPNPPSDEKLRRLEQTLGFPANELVTQAHLHRTPRDVRDMLHKLIADNAQARAAVAKAEHAVQQQGPQPKPGVGGAINLDEAYLSGVLAEMVEKSAGNVERVSTNTVPVINRVSAGYPKDFTDMSYPPRVADDYIGCPDVHDRDAFAARVSGDSMRPKYGEGDIVVFSPAAQPKNGDDCFVRFNDGQTTFKRVFFENDEAGESVIRLQPRNERYRPKVVRSDEVAGLYKAIYRYQRVDED
jgi:SOS-response transcriptional repressor LexA